MTLNMTTQWEKSVFGAIEGENHLLVSITADQKESQKRPPLDLAFALDKSGSMESGNKLSFVKQAVLAAVELLDEHDRVALVTFDSDVQTRTALATMDSDQLHRLKEAIVSIETGSSTNLSGGWLEACRQLGEGASANGRISRAILLTDGRANVGITRGENLMRHARDLRDRGVSTSAIGVGADFDEMLLAGMTEAGGGNFQYIAEASELESFFETELKGLAETVAVKPYLDIVLPEGLHPELINAFPNQAHRQHISVDLRDISAGETVHLVIKVSSRHTRAETVTPEIHLHWTDPSTGTTTEINESGAAIPVGDVSTAVLHEEVATAVALELTASAHRRAVQLDREGRYRESRRMFRDTADMLRHAPRSERAMQAEMRSREMAEMSEFAAMPEDLRKRRVDEAHKHSRGRMLPHTASREYAEDSRRNRAMRMDDDMQSQHDNNEHYGESHMNDNHISRREHRKEHGGGPRRGQRRAWMAGYRQGIAARENLAPLREDGDASADLERRPHDDSRHEHRQNAWRVGQAQGEHARRSFERHRRHRCGHAVGNDVREAWQQLPQADIEQRRSGRGRFSRHAMHGGRPGRPVHRDDEFSVTTTVTIQPTNQSAGQHRSGRGRRLVRG